MSVDGIPADVLDAGTANPLGGGPSFTLRNRLIRMVWQPLWLVAAAWTPRQLHPWRRFLLRSFGARIGRGADVRGSARIWYPPNLVMEADAVIGPRVDCYNQAMVTLGHRALVSQGAFLCAGSHDVDSADFQLVVRPIRIGPYTWIAADAFVGPGVEVGEGAVLGARGVAFRSLEPFTIYRGNPAVEVRKRRVR